MASAAIKAATQILRLHLQWSVQLRTWRQEWSDVMFSENLDSVYNTMMVASVFDGIMEIARWQHLFAIVILTYFLE